MNVVSDFEVFVMIYIFYFGTDNANISDTLLIYLMFADMHPMFLNFDYRPNTDSEILDIAGNNLPTS